MKSSLIIQKNKAQYVLSLIILTMSLIWIAVALRSHSNNATHFNFKEYEKKYYESQWAIPNSKKPISDETLYTYAGYKYINGTNPILINPEAPPLGKYLIGLSILLFNSQETINILVGLFCLVLIYKIIFTVTSSVFYSIIGVFFTSINTLFIDQLIHTPQLEIFQLLFILLIFICVIQYQKNKNVSWIIYIGILLGCFFSIKAFFLHFSLALLWLGIYFFTLNKSKNKKNLFSFVIIITIALIVFTLTYFNYFFHNGTLRGFLGVQKWIMLFYQDSKIETLKIMGGYISLIFFNKWRFWSNGYPLISYDSWSILWPFIYILGIYSVYILKKHQLLLSIISFIGAYSLFLFFIPVFPRYLLLLFIPLTIVGTVFLHSKTSLNKL
ncbi:hypothetical protein COY87_01580 [Candidatus Roizmanbacteria bacterium CG_4_10_14_0_8_um_filter_33_9]|uniref:Glycosyltransferase RgtA/B/C/D-like domain-containing protein n=1 Tax=Candidatus Roizmanbacteria bacterium CG_4_10_14_0_8_um_filter_33_9 TaxID=1974826 RepID=A0A2M7QKE3_9BACT|nr:MAG: hypothetical protein COY87_01580 [Candidatus Roizmanbacteria bacterium CG_4_10_14_0_8_um_filter_33_9]